MTEPTVISSSSPSTRTDAATGGPSANLSRAAAGVPRAKTRTDDDALRAGSAPFRPGSAGTSD
ncbi:hypothetical protein, partial [Frankia sp. AgKG'84/4]|uniref:hypothetical protein n=1 Tax=Frankia sp. AgKG'84/4 TaxID=573490 RepID=UPI002029C60D